MSGTPCCESTPELLLAVIERWLKSFASNCKVFWKFYVFFSGSACHLAETWDLSTELQPFQMCWFSSLQWGAAYTFWTKCWWPNCTVTQAVDLCWAAGFRELQLSKARAANTCRVAPSDFAVMFRVWRTNTIIFRLSHATILQCRGVRSESRSPLPWIPKQVTTEVPSSGEARTAKHYYVPLHVFRKNWVTGVSKLHPLANKYSDNCRPFELQTAVTLSCLL